MGKGKRNEKEREGKGEKEKERRNEQVRRAGTKGWMEALYTNSYAIASAGLVATPWSPTDHTAPSAGILHCSHSRCCCLDQITT